MLTYFFKPAKNRDQERRQANIIARAERLVADGYALVRRSRPTLYGIYKPENVRPERGVWHSDYAVSTKPGYEYCTCQGFADDGDCKHRIAVALEEAAELAEAVMVAQWEADQDACEMSGTGCDPFAEY